MYCIFCWSADDNIPIWTWRRIVWTNPQSLTSTQALVACKLPRRIEPRNPIGLQHLGSYIKYAYCEQSEEDIWKHWNECYGRISLNFHLVFDSVDMVSRSMGRDHVPICSSLIWQCSCSSVLKKLTEYMLTCCYFFVVVRQIRTHVSIIRSAWQNVAIAHHDGNMAQ